MWGHPAHKELYQQTPAKPGRGGGVKVGGLGAFQLPTLGLHPLQIHFLQEGHFSKGFGSQCREKGVRAIEEHILLEVILRKKTLF